MYICCVGHLPVFSLTEPSLGPGFMLPVHLNCPCFMWLLGFLDRLRPGVRSVPWRLSLYDGRAERDCLENTLLDVPFEAI
jgi:hypothetical protein